jgi:ribosome-binding protein aMBF1 (putative translation factor)
VENSTAKRFSSPFFVREGDSQRNLSHHRLSPPNVTPLNRIERGRNNPDQKKKKKVEGRDWITFSHLIVQNSFFFLSSPPTRTKRRFSHRKKEGKACRGCGGLSFLAFRCLFCAKAQETASSVKKQQQQQKKEREKMSKSEDEQTSSQLSSPKTQPISRSKRTRDIKSIYAENRSKDLLRKETDSFRRNSLPPSYSPSATRPSQDKERISLIDDASAPIPNDLAISIRTSHKLRQRVDTIGSMDASQIITVVSVQFEKRKTNQPNKKFFSFISFIFFLLLLFLTSL